MGLDAPPLEDAAVNARSLTARPRARACACLLALAAAGCKPDRPAEAAVTPSRPQATLHGVRMRVFHGEELALVGRAVRLSFNRSTREVTAEEALLQFNPRSRPAELRAPQLRGNLDRRGADLSGGVRLKGPSGLTGETAAAHFDIPTRIATGDQPVRLRGPGYTVQAGGFQLDFNEEAFDFQGAVATELAAELKGTRP